jgi:hypothetical protein
MPGQSRIRSIGLFPAQTGAFYAALLCVAKPQSKTHRIFEQGVSQQENSTPPLSNGEQERAVVIV